MDLLQNWATTHLLADSAHNWLRDAQNNAFVRRLDGRVQVLRVVNKWDMIPHIPGERDIVAMSPIGGYVATV